MYPCPPYSKREALIKDTVTYLLDFWGIVSSQQTALEIFTFMALYFMVKSQKSYY